ANFDSLVGHILPVQDGESAQPEPNAEPQITTNPTGASADELSSEAQSESLPTAETRPSASPISDDLMAFMAPLAAPVTETVEEAVDATSLDETLTPSSDAVDTALEALTQTRSTSDSEMTTDAEQAPHILL
ncbi:hypothetical protein BTO01_28095, partial [Vibrio jasicida]|uniref:hypothetical protein n=1 Tax=Vibrio jasicida TaxID=766224 RepID=UPI000D46AA6E